jgi:hypothetical protein
MAVRCSGTSAHRIPDDHYLVIEPDGALKRFCDPGCLRRHYVPRPTKKAALAAAHFPGEGDRVRHPRFGEGVVLSHRDARGDRELTIVFEAAGTKRLLASLAPLERLWGVT